MNSSTRASAGASATAPPHIKRQAAVIFQEISMLGSCVERMSILLVSSDDERDVAALQTAIQRMSGAIGLLSEIGSDLCGGDTWRHADPCKWFLPPSFFSKGESETAGRPS